MTNKPTLFGAAYSVYVRIARLTLLEKGVAYDHVPIDVFGEEGPPASYLNRHPFGRIPSFEHAGFRLFETGAITRYIDDAFDGPQLLPAGAHGRARCNQLISIADNYVYPRCVWDIYVERIMKPDDGTATDETKVASAIPIARTCLRAISDIKGNGDWLTGSQLTLADLYLAPMFFYFLMTTEGKDMVRESPRLAAWWTRMSDRPSMKSSAP